MQCVVLHCVVSCLLLCWEGQPVDMAGGEVPMDDMHTHDFQSGSRETARVPRAQTAADIGERQQHSLQSVEPPTNDARPYWRKTSRKQQLLRNFKGTATPD